MVKYPCKDCNDRHVGCHSECDKYNEKKEENDKRKKAMYEQYMNSSTITRLEVNMKRSMTHRKRVIKDSK